MIPQVFSVCFLNSLNELFVTHERSTPGMLFLSGCLALSLALMSSLLPLPSRTSISLFDFWLLSPRPSVFSKLRSICVIV